MGILKKILLYLFLIFYLLKKVTGYFFVFQMIDLWRYIVGIGQFFRIAFFTSNFFIVEIFSSMLIFLLKIFLSWTKQSIMQNFFLLFLPNDYLKVHFPSYNFIVAFLNSFILDAHLVQIYFIGALFLRFEKCRLLFSHRLCWLFNLGFIFVFFQRFLLIFSSYGIFFSKIGALFKV